MHTADVQHFNHYSVSLFLCYSLREEEEEEEEKEEEKCRYCPLKKVPVSE